MCAFIGVDRLQINGMAHDMIFLRDAIAAMHVARGAGNIQRLALGDAVGEVATTPWSVHARCDRSERCALREECWSPASCPVPSCTPRLSNLPALEALDALPDVLRGI